MLGLAADAPTDTAAVNVPEKKGEHAGGVRAVAAVQAFIGEGLRRHSSQIVTAIKLLLLVAYFGYFG